MKNWENAQLVELEISETAQGGRDIESVDNLWTDVNTGNLYASYASGGNGVGNGFIEVKPAN